MISAVRLATSHACCDLLGLDAFNEDHLYANLAWLSENQADIELRLKAGVFQMELFDQPLAEVCEPAACYVLRRNPRRAEEMQATRQSKLDSLARRVDQANLYLTEHPRAKVATAVKSLQNQITKLKLASWVAYILVWELARRWIDLDLTVEEGINKLATLCVTEIIGDGKVRCGTVPQPRPDVVELLARSGIPMPAVIRSRGVKVATKKKLPPSRANRF